MFPYVSATYYSINEKKLRVTEEQNYTYAGHLT